MLDPAQGARRRALARDKVIRATRKTRDAAGAARRDANHRLTGIAARLRSRFGPDDADDRVICERVRAELGRTASHPRAIAVESIGGYVTLTGDALASEAPSIVSAAEGVAGVCGVNDELKTHASAATVPSLQGVSRRPNHWMTWLTEGWSPTAMLIAGASAVALGTAAAAAARR